MSAETFLETTDGSKLSAVVVHDRRWHRLLRTHDGRAAKLVKGSWRRSVRSLEDITIRALRIRNYREWQYLRRQTHPSFPRVDGRVKDEWGDEGFLCEWLDALELGTPHPLTGTTRDLLRGAILLSQAVGQIHKDRFIHGDITDGNVCLREGTPVLIDYEMSICIGQYLTREPATPSNCFCATPSCCSPEQVKGERIFPPSDIYCLGLTILSWVSGFPGVWGPDTTIDDALEMCERGVYPHWDIVHERLRHAQSLEEALRQAVRVRPEDRFRDGTALALALEGVYGVLTDAQLARPIVEPDPAVTPESVPAVHVDHDVRTSTLCGV